MPRPPQVLPHIAALRSGVYASARPEGQPPAKRYPLNVGDTWLEPAPECRVQALDEATTPGLNRYTSPHGHPALIEAIIAYTAASQGLSLAPEEVLVTNGATGGLAVVCGTLLAPEEEVLVLAPFWPLISGAIRSAGARPVAVPCFGEGLTVEAMIARLEAALSPATVALYYNSPNNPTGEVLPAPLVAALVAFARRHDLWIFSDEVYEHYSYVGEHVYTRPLAPERTIANHSFSKAFGMAGYRCGYLHGPKAIVGELGKLSMHRYYSAPTPAQIVAARALAGPGLAWAQAAVAQYREVGEAVAKMLGCAPPEGSTFLFVDVAEALDERGLQGLLADCAREGLIISPGTSFGPYPTHVRLCFTAAPPEVTLEGAAILARRMGRAAAGA